MIENTLYQKLFKEFYRKIDHEVSEDFSRLMIEAIKSGDFQMHLDIEKNSMFDPITQTISLQQAYGLTYLPYRRVTELELKIERLEKEIERLREIEFMYDGLCK